MMARLTVRGPRAMIQPRFKAMKLWKLGDVKHGSTLKNMD